MAKIDGQTIFVLTSTKTALDELKIHPRETYNDVIAKLIKKKEAEQ